MNYRNRKLLDLANGAPCANCSVQDGTIVAAHSNQSRHGKGAMLKAHDCHIAFLCIGCHSWLDFGSKGRDPTGRWDATREDKAEMFDWAKDITTRYLWENELIKVA